VGITGKREFLGRLAITKGIPGHIAQRSRLLLGPADEALLIKLRGAARHILSSDLNSFLKMIGAPDEINCGRGSQEPNVPRRASPFEQRLGAAPLAELCGNFDPHPGDFGFQFGDIGFEFRDPQQGQVLWLRRFAPRF
jgi:hypothetical protein